MREIESAPRLMVVVAVWLFCAIEIVVADKVPEALATIESAPKEIEPFALKFSWLMPIDWALILPFNAAILIVSVPTRMPVALAPFAWLPLWSINTAEARETEPPAEILIASEPITLAPVAVRPVWPMYTLCPSTLPTVMLFAAPALVVIEMLSFPRVMLPVTATGSM